MKTCRIKHKWHVCIELELIRRATVTRKGGGEYEWQGRPELFLVLLQCSRCGEREYKIPNIKLLKKRMKRGEGKDGNANYRLFVADLWLNRDDTYFEYDVDKNINVIKHSDYYLLNNKSIPKDVKMVGNIYYLKEKSK